MTSRPIALLTDFGVSEYVGIMKGVILIWIFLFIPFFLGNPQISRYQRYWYYSQYWTTKCYSSCMGFAKFLSFLSTKCLLFLFYLSSKDYLCLCCWSRCRIKPKSGSYSNKYSLWFYFAFFFFFRDWTNIYWPRQWCSVSLGLCLWWYWRIALLWCTFWDNRR
jgi:hypothetical protein